MVKVITVEREYGSRGGEFAQLLAGKLSWRLVDQCLIEEIAEKAGVAKSVVEQCDERLDPWYRRLSKSFWYGSVEGLPGPPDEAVFFDGDYLAGLVRDYLRQTAEQGNCVIVGRGSASALGALAGVFNVFVYASMARKIRWFEEQFPRDAAHARREIEAADSRRETYIRRYYNCDWSDRRLYHLMINSCVGFDAMIQATIDGAGLGKL